MSDSVRPHRQQPTRLRHPWDSPGKNTGVGCHFLLQCMKVKVKSLSKRPTLHDPMDYSLPGSSIHGIFQARVLEWVATSGQTMVEVKKIMVTSLKRSKACTATVRAPYPTIGHNQPTPSLETPGYPQASRRQSVVESLLLSSWSWCTSFRCALQ